MLSTLLAFIAVVATAVLMTQRRRTLLLAAQAQQSESQVIWDFSINEELCIGCDQCVQICPRDVLELIPATQVVRVARGSDCIQCRACDHACPTSALRMYPRGGPRPTLELPDVDASYQPAGLSGLYLVGQSAGKPRIKDTINLGQAAVEHMVLAGLKPQTLAAQASTGKRDLAVLPGQPPGRVDVAVIGAGPAGLAAAVACAQHGLAYVLLEKEASPLSTIVRYPKGKRVHSLPQALKCVSPLQFQDCTKEELVEKWQDVKAAFQIREAAEVMVTDVRRRGSEFEVVTDRRGTYQAQRVIVAVGGRGQPRLLPKVSEAEQHLPHVHKLLDRPDLVRSKKVLVVGGGDSAIEATLALCRPELNNVVFVVYYRHRKFLRGSAENLRKLLSAERRHEVELLDQADIVSIAAGSVTIERRNRSRVLPIDEVYVLIGSHSNQEFLQKLGVTVKVFDQGTFAREATDQLVQRLIAGQRKKGIYPARSFGMSQAVVPLPVPVNPGSSSPPADIWGTTLQPNLAEQIRRQHENSRAAAAPNTSPDVAPLDTIWQTRFEPSTAQAAASRHVLETTERVTAAQSSAPSGPRVSAEQSDEPSTVQIMTPLSGTPLALVDATFYRTIRIPMDQYLWRMPAKAAVPKHALTLAEREAASRTTERKQKKGRAE